MANVRNTVTDTYQGETIECAQFVIDTVNQYGEALFTTCSIKEDGYYAFQMIAKASTNNTLINVQIANNTVEFTLTDQWAKYETIVQCQYNTSEPMANKLIFYFPLGTFYMYHSKLEKGNKVTDWSENSDFTNETIETVWSQATQTATQLSWIIAGGTSSTNFTLTNRTAQLVAGLINLQGLVTFGGLSDAIVGAVLGNNDINMLINHSSVQYTSSKVLFAYSKNSLENKSTTIEWQGNFIDVSLGIIADYNLWTSTIKGYCPSGKFDIYHIYDTTPGISDARHHMDIWKYNNTWYQVTYNISGTNISIGTSGATTKSTLAGKASRYACIGIVSLQKSSNNITLTDVHALKQFYKYDVDRDDFVEQNTNSTLGSILGKLCSDANMTLINGGKIATGSIDADKLSVNDLYALGATIAQWIIASDSISKKDSTATLEEYIDKGWSWNATNGVSQTSSVHEDRGFYKSTLSPNARFLAQFLDADDEPISSTEYTGQGIYNTLTQNYLLRLLSDGVLISKLQGTNMFSQAMYGVDGYFTNVNAINIKAGTNDVWHQGNLVCGKITSSSVTGNTGSAVTISLPTAQIGTDPIVTVTTTGSNDNAWLGGITISGSNTLINIGIFNGSSSAHTITVNYMIAKG